MLRIGVTGGIASGKSTLCRLFCERHGVTLLDTDQIAHQLVEPPSPVLDQIGSTLGNDLIKADGSLNRPLLRERVFSDDTKLTELEALMHPAIRSELNQQIAQASNAPYLLIAIPLLFEKGWQGTVDRILVLDLQPSQQRQRALARNPNLSAETLESILHHQVSRDLRLSGADDIVDNSHGSEALVAQVDRLHTHYLQLANHH